MDLKGPGDELKEAILASLLQRRSHLILDISALQYINSRGIFIIGYCYSRYSQAGIGKKLILIGPNDRMLKVFNTVGLTKAIIIC